MNKINLLRLLLFVLAATFIQQVYSFSLQGISSFCAWRELQLCTALKQENIQLEKQLSKTGSVSSAEEVRKQIYQLLSSERCILLSEKAQVEITQRKDNAAENYVYTFSGAYPRTCAVLFKLTEKQLPLYFQKVRFQPAPDQKGVVCTLELKILRVNS